MSWIHDLPRWLVAFVILAVFVASALAGLFATRRLIKQQGLHSLIDNGVVGWIFSATLSIYAITIGLTAVASWSNAVSASNVTSAEAAEVAALYRAVSTYPQPARGALKAGVRGYLAAVIDMAWPAQRRGEVPHGPNVALTGLQQSFSSFEPATDGQRILHAEALHVFAHLVEARRRRLVAVDNGVPGALWSVVLVGAVLAICGSYVFSIESVATHAVMTALLSAMIALLVFFIAVTDRPFRGAAGIPPSAYELVLHTLVDGDSTP